MLRALKIRIQECKHPVGIKRSSLRKLPPKDHVYGYKIPPDPEGADSSKL